MGLTNDERQSIVAYRIEKAQYGGMLTLINQHFVQTGQLSKDEGRLLKKMYTLRQEGDYEDFVEVTDDEIKMYLPLVESLEQKIIALIG